MRVSKVFIEQQVQRTGILIVKYRQVDLKGAAHRNIACTKTTTPPDYHNDDYFYRQPDDLIKISVVFEGRLIEMAF
jgi:hypothetical protein